MGTKEEKQIMRRRNMKLFPIYKSIAWDYLFFYTIDFIFLTQVKNISASDVVLKTTFFSLFGIILQIPANVIVEYFGRRNSLIIGNILNCLYIFMLIISRSLSDLIFAEFFSAIACAIKGVAEPSLLNESIPPSKYKGKIFSKLNSKGTSGYYLLSSISKIISGYMFQINGYLPMICSLIVMIVTVILSMYFIEPVKKKKINFKKIMGKQQFKDAQIGFKFVLKSERLKALLVASSLICTLLIIFSNYNVSLLDELNISSVIIGYISATLTMLSSYSSKLEKKINEILKNKTLITIALLLSIGCLLSGIFGLFAGENNIFLILLIIAFFTYGIVQGSYYTIIDKYLRSFSNKDIDTKIFAVNKLATSFGRVIGGLFASFLLDKMKTAYCMITIGIIFTVLYILMAEYMKTRVGLDPKKYSKEEKKYDEIERIEEA